MFPPIRIRNTLLAFCLLLLVPASAVGLSTPSGTSLATSVPYVRGEILVQWQDMATATTARSAVIQAGLTIRQEILPLRVARLAVPPGQEWTHIEKLRRCPLIAYAEPNYLVYAAEGDLQPNDPDWSKQWNMSRIEMPTAWALSTGQPGVSVAVLDTGVDTGHPDLSASLLAGYDFVNNDADPDDDHGHGTHVAGIIAAQLNNGLGVAGVAPHVSILPLKVLNKEGTGDHFQVSQGMLYAIANGARILNLSFAGPSSETLSAAVRNAYDAGALLIAATGNGGLSSVSYPACYTEVLAIAATDYNDRWPSYSNWGLEVDLAAPGGTSVNQIWSTWRTESYAWDYGTSMAVPHVSGAAALIQSVAPTLSRDEVASILRQTADQVGQFAYTGSRNDHLGYGRLNVQRALRQALPPTLTVQPAQLIFLGDSQQSPAAQQLVLSNESTQTLQWQAEKLSGGSWLDLLPPLSGNITYQYPGRLWVMITGGLDYGVYEGSIRISSSTLGAQGTPRTVPVRLILVPQLTRVYLPMVENR